MWLSGEGLSWSVQNRVIDVMISMILSGVSSWDQICRGVSLVQDTVTYEYSIISISHMVCREDMRKRRGCRWTIPYRADAPAMPRNGDLSSRVKLAIRRCNLTPTSR